MMSGASVPRARVATRSKKAPGLLAALEQVLDDATAGDPISGLKWSRKTLRRLRHALAAHGFRIGIATLARLLKARRYRLRVNRKTRTAASHPQRDRQFRYLSRLRRVFQRVGAPVIRVDTKKKELIGPFKNAGRTWRQAPQAVWEHDFP